MTSTFWSTNSPPCGCACRTICRPGYVILAIFRKNLEPLFGCSDRTCQHSRAQRVEILLGLLQANSWGRSHIPLILESLPILARDDPRAHTSSSRGMARRMSLGTQTLDCRVSSARQLQRAGGPASISHGCEPGPQARRRWAKNVKDLPTSGPSSKPWQILDISSTVPSYLQQSPHVFCWLRGFQDWVRVCLISYLVKTCCSMQSCPVPGCTF